MAKEPKQVSARSSERRSKQGKKGLPAAEPPARRKAGSSRSGDQTSAHNGFPIIGIGASAGGVEALGRFFDAMPADCGCAFVIVLHLDPTRESQMAHVLASHTEMPVLQVKDGMPIAPNHVYVIAPDNDLKVGNGVLHMTKPVEPRGHRKPVDVLFASLAGDQGDRSIAIVLSGTGTNGTEGLKDVRSEGGMILVQAPDSAKFDGMPRSAISAGLADYVLPPGKMPEALLAYIRHDYHAGRDELAVAPDAHATFAAILDILRTRGGHDFRAYKQSTLRRRIHRRLGLRNIAALDEYARILRDDSEEAAALARDLMISVTGFFRDPEAWQALEEKVIVPMVAGRENRSSIRVWTPGCSTGEEAYSVAMLVTEQAENAGKHFDLKVFATDPQDDNLRKARDGIYPQAALTDFPPERLRRFFDKLDGSYQVKKDLRDMVVIAPQNLLRDPPFSRLDLVSCRNLLIYLEADAQRKIIALAHFALREGGHLFLGNAETVGRHEDLFETVSKKWRIYRRVGPTRHDLMDFPPPRGSRDPHKPDELPAFPDKAAPVAEVARRALLERYAPASVLIDRKCRVLYYHGPTGDYLEQPTGEPTKDLLAMARQGLSAKLRAIVREALAGKKRVTAKTSMRQGDLSRSVTLTVTPLPAGDRILVSFEEASTAPAPSKSTRRHAGEKAAGERDLQEELKAVRAELQNTIENLETANEELKAANEEATSMNEELQSTNEELETSKEELQSFNEELNTVNSQLQHKIVEQEATANDLNNLLAGSEIATLFLDTNFCIKWFSPATRELFDLVSSDVGRPVGHFARKFADENLLPNAETVLKKLTTIEAEVSADSGRWYLRRMLPYRTRDNRIAGVVITFSDITERKRAADAATEARIYAEAVVATIRQPLLVLDGELRVLSANRSFYARFHVTKEQTEGKLVHELGNGQWDIPRLRALLKEVLSEDREFTDFEIEHDFRDIGRRFMLLNARKLRRGKGRDELVLLAIEDATARKESEKEIRQSERRLKDLIGALPGAVYTTDAKGLITSYNPAAVELWGREPELGLEEWCGSWRMYRPDGTPLPHDQCPMAVALKEERAISGEEAVVERPDGVLVPLLVYPTPLRDASGAVTGAVNMMVDISERKKAEALAERLAAIVASSDDAIISKDLDGVITSWNKGAERLFGYVTEEIIGKPITTLIPPDRRDEEIRIIEGVRRGEHMAHYETVRLRKDGSRVWVSLTVSPLRDANGRIIGASKIARDMTERRRADEHRKILVRELNHRVKNTLAVVRSIASQTLGQASSLEEAASEFGSRLVNLAKAHDVLTRENWAGANLANIVADTVNPHAAGEGRFHIEGPHVQLRPSAALAIAMALHELSTNAAKYGALSSDKGKIDILWAIGGNGDGRHLNLRWMERDGPPVLAPKRKGFGSRLIERALAQELGGEVRISYEPSGVVCTIEAPMPEGRDMLEETDGQPDDKVVFDRR